LGGGGGRGRRATGKGKGFGMAGLRAGYWKRTSEEQEGKKRVPKKSIGAEKRSAFGPGAPVLGMGPRGRVQGVPITGGRVSKAGEPQEKKEGQEAYG